MVLMSHPHPNFGQIVCQNPPPLAHRLLEVVHLIGKDASLYSLCLLLVVSYLSLLLLLHYFENQWVSLRVLPNALPEREEIVPKKRAYNLSVYASLNIQKALLPHQIHYYLCRIFYAKRTEIET